MGHSTIIRTPSYREDIRQLCTTISRDMVVLHKLRGLGASAQTSINLIIEKIQIHIFSNQDHYKHIIPELLNEALINNYVDKKAREVDLFEALLSLANRLDAQTNDPDYYYLALEIRNLYIEAKNLQKYLEKRHKTKKAVSVKIPLKNKN